MTLDQILAVYNGSDADATRALFAKLQTLAPRGLIAMNLLRVCKASERAKKYRGRAGRGQPTYRRLAYDKKDWSIGELCRALVLDEDTIPSWGWGFDAKAIGFEHVLYVDIPVAGQVSFHTEHRRDGPTYTGIWDGARGTAPDRICRWTEAVLNGQDLTNEGGHDELHARTEGAPAETDAGGPVREEGEQEAFDL